MPPQLGQPFFELFGFFQVIGDHGGCSAFGVRCSAFGLREGYPKAERRPPNTELGSGHLSTEVALFVLLAAAAGAGVVAADFGFGVVEVGGAVAVALAVAAGGGIGAH